MKDNERLTISSLEEGYTLKGICEIEKVNGGEFIEEEHSCGFICDCMKDDFDSCSESDCPIRKAFNRLAEYENTGLSPDEIYSVIEKANHSNNNPFVPGIIKL